MLNIHQFEYYFTHKIWTIDDGKLPAWKKYFLNMLKKLVITIECFINKNINNYASALTYSTLFATVPILAIIFAIGRGFGYGSVVENEIRNNLRVNQEFADLLFNFIGSYLDHTKSGIFIGFGLILLLYTIIQLTSNIELAMNKIWQVKSQRSVYRQITDYISVFLLLPVLMIISSGLSIFMATIAEHFPNFIVLSKTVRLTITLSPYVLSSLLFIGLYMYMPNTNVQLRSAFLPGVIAGIGFQALQYLYIHSQIWVSTYNAIYGSFAALPLFMIWINFSWIICLFCAQLSFANQNIKSYFYIKDMQKISRNYHDMLAMLVMSKICKRFEKGMKPYSVYGLGVETGLPIGVLSKLTHELKRMNLLVSEQADNGGERFSPASDINTLTVSKFLERIDNSGIAYTPSAFNVHAQEWETLFKIRSQHINDHLSCLIKDL